MRVFLAAVFTVACLTASAQLPINTKFGKPTKEEMEMTVYPADSTAEAVVLCRLTTVNYSVQTNGYLVDYHEKFRIKVLKPEGARFAQVTVPYYKNTQQNGFIGGSRFSLLAGIVSFDYSAGSFTENAWGNYTDESVEDVKAVAFNQVNGKTVKTSMKKDAITTEKIDNENFLLKFNIPEVREGTVIEYEYSIHSELFYMLRDWQPQCEIPVAYASLDMEIPCYLIFNMEERGIQRLKCRCVGGVMRYKLESDPLAKPVEINTNHYFMTGQDLKAMPEVPYVWNMQDHRAGISAELRGYSQRGASFYEFLKDWDQVDRLLLDNNYLGKQMNNHSPLREELQAAGTLTGTRQSTYSGNAALLYRQQKGISDFSPSVTDSVSFTRKGIVEGDRISICPFNTPPMPENPFSAAQRMEPVEFPFPQTEQVVVNITLPDGYTVEQKPEALSLTTTDKSVNGRLVTSVEDNRVQVLYQLNISKIEQPQANYQSLRQLFELFAEHSNDLLVVKKGGN